MKTGVDAALIKMPAKRGTSNANPPNNAWFSNHWKWVVMVIVIFVAILIFWIGGIYLRRHIQRKREAARANMAAKDAANLESNPTANTLQKTPQSTVSPPMTMMSGGRSGMPSTMDGGIGGIAPPRPGPGGAGGRSRSRSGTLRSMTARSGSQPRMPDQGPVVWGPHQHHAASHEPIPAIAYPPRQNTGSPAHTLPPSPTIASQSRGGQIYSNEHAMRSEPRFANYRASPNKITVDTGVRGASTGQASVSPVSPIDRPGTAPPARLRELRHDAPALNASEPELVSKKSGKLSKRNVS